MVGVALAKKLPRDACCAAPCASGSVEALVRRHTVYGAMPAIWDNPYMNIVPCPRTRPAHIAMLQAALAAYFIALANVVIGQAAPAYRVEGAGIPEPLAAPGDAARGRALVTARDPANCILCHGVAAAAVRFAGDLAPPLDGVGARLSLAQLRLRLVDSAILNPQSIMPAYYRTEGLTQVAAAYRGKTILTGQQIEDLVVYLSTLR